MWYNKRFFKYAVGTLLILLIIFMLGKINFFLSPFKLFISTILAPILTAGLFYYILRPLVQLLEKHRLSRVLAIIISFAVILVLIALISTYTGSMIAGQLNQLYNDFPKGLEIAREKTSGLLDERWLQYFSTANIQQKIAGYLEMVTQSLSALVLGFLSALTNIGTVLLLVPFMLFYFLKDDHRFSTNLLKAVPKKHRQNIAEILHDIDAALSSYILGQMLVALAIGILMYIGYLIIGLKYSIILAIFAMITCIIPYFGPWIGIIPAALVGLMTSPFMALKVVIVMLVVQQIDGNFISPQVMRRSLDIHPVTIILLLTGSVSLYGFVGLLVAVPFYAAIKVTVKNIYNMYILDRISKET